MQRVERCVPVRSAESPPAIDADVQDQVLRTKPGLERHRDRGAARAGAMFTAVPLKCSAMTKVHLKPLMESGLTVDMKLDSLSLPAPRVYRRVYRSAKILRQVNHGGLDGELDDKRTPKSSRWKR